MRFADVIDNPFPSQETSSAINARHIDVDGVMRAVFARLMVREGFNELELPPSPSGEDEGGAARLHLGPRELLGPRGLGEGFGEPLGDGGMEERERVGHGLLLPAESTSR